MRHNLSPYGWDGWAAVAQIESQVDIASAPTERAAFGTRDSFLGIEGPWGSLKAGKTDTPYKKATAAFDPFSRTIADYNSIMGNTGGDNRVEFGLRAAHAIWYESPSWSGVSFKAMYSPGQNRDDTSSIVPSAEPDCNRVIRGSGAPASS